MNHTMPSLLIACVVLGCSDNVADPIINGSSSSTTNTVAAGTGGAGMGGGGGGVGGMGGAPGGPLVPSLVGMNLVLDCMPDPPADPVSGFFTANYDNGAGTAAAAATIMSTKLIVTNGLVTEEWTFEADPLSSGSIAAGASQSISHDKVAASLMTTSAPCDFCTRGSSWSLEVMWDVSGSNVTDTLDPVGLACVF